jgi:hypothetical protein
LALHHLEVHPMAEHRELAPEAFERLREQIATASARCSDDQILTLADGLHDVIRRRSARRAGEARRWATSSATSTVENRT